jgi:hypothetical protein
MWHKQACGLTGVCAALLEGKGLQSSDAFLCVHPWYKVWLQIPASFCLHTLLCAEPTRQRGPRRSVCVCLSYFTATRTAVVVWRGCCNDYSSKPVLLLSQLWDNSNTCGEKGTVVNGNRFYRNISMLHRI